MLRKPVIILEILVLLAILYIKYFNSVTRTFLESHTMLHAIVSFLVYYLIIKFLSAAIKAYYSKRSKIPYDKKNNVHFGIENIANILIAFGFMGLIMRFIGINPFEIITSATIVAAAVALVTRDYIADFFSGIYLSFSNTFEIGDYVKLDSQKGKILEIGMLKIKILNDDDDVVIMPNFKVYFNEIVNYTKRDVRLMSIDFELALKYVISIEELEKDLVASLESFSDFIDPKSYNLKVVEVKFDYLGMKFQYKLQEIDAAMQREIRKKTMREVFNYISERSQMRKLSGM